MCWKLHVDAYKPIKGRKVRFAATVLCGKTQEPNPGISEKREHLYKHRYTCKVTKILVFAMYFYARPNSGVAAAGKLQILAVFTICTPTKFVLLWGPWKENAPLLLLDVVCRFNTVQNHWGLLEKHPSWFGRSWSWTTESSQSGAYGMKEWQGFARDQSCPVIVGWSQHPYLVRQ